MALLLYLLLLLLLLLLAAGCSDSLIPPSPNFYPSSTVNSTRFDQELRNLWGPYHQHVDQNGLTIWLDRTSGSGFKSLRSYTSGYFGASIKLQAGYTAGVIACLYLSNNEAIPGKHDEIDMEFLGQTNEEPYVLQTNVYMNGSGDGNLVGREMRFHLWFDPTAAFHHYAILWNPQEIIFLVDDIPIRKYKKRSTSTFPLRPMWVYGSIWDASSWATDNGKYKADYSYQPFIARYKDFKISGCDAAGNSSCRPATASPTGAYGLSDVQHSALRWVQRSYVIYYYCHDLNRDHSVTPECGGE